MGINNQPITLSKSLSAHFDAVNFTHSTGNFGLASFGVLINIHVTLTITNVSNFSAFIAQAIGTTLQLSGKAATNQH